MKHTRASEIPPPDPVLDKKMAELEQMSETQTNEKLQAMMVSQISV